MKTITFLAALGLAGAAGADTPEKMLEDLRTEIRAELRASLDQTDKANADATERIIGLESILIEELPEHDLTAGPMDKTLAGLVKLRAFTHSKKADGLVNDLVLEVSKAIAREQKKFAEAYHPALQKALEAGLQSDKEEEIDGALASLQGLKHRMEEFTDSQGNQTKVVNSDALDTVSTALRGWQNGVIGMRSQPADLWTALNALREMEASYDESLSEIIPRSEFLRLVRSIRERWKLEGFLRNENKRRVAETQKILREVKNLADIDGALEGLRALEESARPNGTNPEAPDEASNPSDTARVMAALHELKEASWDLRMGLSSALPRRPHPANPVPVEQGDEAGAMAALPPAFEPEVDRIYQFLLREALAPMLGIEEAPTANENASAYLHRIAGRSMAEKNWSLLQKTLDAAEQFRGAEIFATRDALAMRYLLAAMNQERARRYSPAVASYLVALRSGSQIIPAEWMGDQLAAIQKEHAEEYAAGQHLAAEPLPAIVLPKATLHPGKAEDEGGPPEVLR